MNQGYKEYIRLNTEGDSICLEVCDITWDGPHTPITKWKVVGYFIEPISIEQLDNKISKLLKNKRYFGYCIKCNAHFLSGHMSIESHCQTCAEKHFNMAH